MNAPAALILPPRKPEVPFHPAGSKLDNRFGILVVEIAANLEPLADILQRHRISKSQFANLSKDPIFLKAVVEQRRHFNSYTATSERVRIKSQIITEMLLDQMYDIAKFPNNPAAARVAAFAQIKSLTGMERPEQAEPPQRFALTINLDHKSVHVDNSFAVPSPPPPVQQQLLDQSNPFESD